MTKDSVLTTKDYIKIAGKVYDLCYHIDCEYCPFGYRPFDKSEAYVCYFMKEIGAYPYMWEITCPAPEGRS